MAVVEVLTSVTMLHKNSSHTQVKNTDLLYTREKYQTICVGRSDEREEAVGSISHKLRTWLISTDLLHDYLCKPYKLHKMELQGVLSTCQFHNLLCVCVCGCVPSSVKNTHRVF